MSTPPRSRGNFDWSICSSTYTLSAFWRRRKIVPSGLKMVPKTTPLATVKMAWPPPMPGTPGMLPTTPCQTNDPSFGVSWPVFRSTMSWCGRSRRMTELFASTNRVQSSMVVALRVTAPPGGFDSHLSMRNQGLRGSPGVSARAAAGHPNAQTSAAHAHATRVRRAHRAPCRDSAGIGLIGAAVASQTRTLAGRVGRRRGVGRAAAELQAGRQVVASRLGGTAG